MYPQDDLKAAGYTLETSSLERALRDTRVGIRSAAAGLLSSQGDTSALPAVEQALSVEKNPNVAFTMTWSALSLGDQSMEKRLVSYCLDSQDSSTKSIAADILLRRGNTDCIPAELEHQPAIGRAPYSTLTELPLALKTRLKQWINSC